MLKLDSALSIEKSSFHYKRLLQILILVAGLEFLLFYWGAHFGVSLADEGFLWYGAQRVLAGEIPIRDFMAYDPGRYYFIATIMKLYGSNSIIVLRAAEIIFQAIGLFIGLMTLVQISRKSKDTFWWWLLVAITLLIWMCVREKVFDTSLSIILIASIAFLIQRPTSYRYFLTGFLVGFIAFFGRNHGVYGVIGCISAMLYIQFDQKQSPKFLQSFTLWSLGIIVGYLPMIIMIIKIPGFAAAFWESIRFLFENKATNIPLPIPWPWRLTYGHASLFEILNGIFLGIFFIAIVAFGVLGIAWLIWQKKQKKAVSPVLAATIFLALPYAHYAYSRAEIAHLSFGIFPFIIGILALLATQSTRIKWSFALVLCSASLLVTWSVYANWICWGNQCVGINVTGSEIKVDRGTASDVTMLYALAEKFAPNNRSFIVSPFWPGAYAILERKAPTWETYPLFPRDIAFQKAEIERIKAANPGFAIILDYPLDGREELQFRHTHPLIDQYISAHFKLLKGYSENPYYRIYRRDK